MGWIKTLRNSSIGPAGTVRLVDAGSERVLLALGLAEGVPDPRLAPKPEPKPKRTYRKKVVQAEAEEKPKPKRTYKRKDMQAEEPAEVVIQPPDPEPLEDPVKDGDEPVRV